MPIGIRHGSSCTWVTASSDASGSSLGRTRIGVAIGLASAWRGATLAGCAGSGGGGCPRGGWAPPGPGPGGAGGGRGGGLGGRGGGGEGGGGGGGEKAICGA